MTRPKEKELKRAKEMFLAGKNDAEVAKALDWSQTRAWEVRTYMLRLPPNRSWRDEKKNAKQS